MSFTDCCSRLAIFITALGFLYFFVQPLITKIVSTLRKKAEDDIASNGIRGNGSCSTDSHELSVADSVLRPTDL
jgi:hypothetical protein